MSDNTNDGGPAFPAVQTTQEGSAGEYTMDVHSVGGMSLRDYFAAKAMQALMHPDIAKALPSGRETEYMANGAYDMADAMLAAREVKS